MSLTRLVYPFDGAGRLTQVLYWQPPGAGYVNVWSAGVSKYSYYDAEDHLTHQKSLSGGFENTGNDEYFFWGPGGRAIVGTYDTSVYRGYHWDGADLAFTSLQNGSVNDYKLGSDGDLLTADSNQTGASANHYSGAVYYDRGDAGYAEASHDAGGYSSFCANAGEYYVNPCGLGTPSGQTPAFYTAGFGPDLTAYPGDGVTDGFVVLQGSRNYEAATGQWTTPDAYEGDISDPMSQAKYMWNRNNPVAYSDPSGYCTVAAQTVIKNKHGQDERISGIGCVDAKPVPPGNQLMPDGRTVRDTVQEGRRETEFLGQAIMLVAPGGEEAEGGYLTFEAFKAAFGRAGAGFAWHHIVEKNASNVEKFGPRAIHNIENMVVLDEPTHNIISGMYNSKGVRDAISAMSYEEQRAEGIKVLQDLDKWPR